MSGAVEITFFGRSNFLTFGDLTKSLSGRVGLGDMSNDYSYDRV